MAKFRFRFETLLRVRAARREVHRQRLAKAFRAREILQERAEQLKAALREVENNVRSASQPGVIDVGQLLNQQRYELLLRGQMSQVKEQRTKIDDEAKRLRAELVESNKQVRVLETLREHDLTAHREQQLLREARELDEISQRTAALERRR